MHRLAFNAKAAAEMVKDEGTAGHKHEGHLVQAQA